MYDIPGVTYTTISGFHGGIFTNIRIGDAVALEPGAYYSMKGWKATGSFEDNTGTLEGTMTNKLAYIDAPLLFRFYIKGLNFGAGPQASLLLKSTVESVGELNQVSFSETKDTTVELSDFDFALVLSFGYEFDFGLSVHATYDLGLTNNVVLSPYQTWDEAHNRVLKFSIGFVIY